jgi:ribonuclease HI
MRRRKEPDARELIRFIAEHESLTLTCDEFPDLPEERIRDILRQSIMTPELKARARRAKEDVFSVKVFTDGASRGNPGPAGAGWVIRGVNDALLSEGNAFLGHKTNNEAEYEALLHALQAAHALGAVDVNLRSDSELLVRQINGQYQVRNERLMRLHSAARELIRTFRRFDVRHISRTENAAADAQANRAIDEALGS